MLKKFTPESAEVTELIGLGLAKLLPTDIKLNHIIRLHTEDLLKTSNSDFTSHVSPRASSSVIALQ